MVDRDLDAESRVIRIFPGYAGSVLWAWSGLIEYDASGLSPRLIEALRRWEALGEREVATGEALADAEESLWIAEGARLASAIADELGSGFTVEMRVGTSEVLATSHRLPTNPAAASRFESARVDAVAERREGPTPERSESGRHVPLKGRDLGQA